MRVYILVIDDCAVCLIDSNAPAFVDCDGNPQAAIVEIFPAEPRDTIPSPPPDPDSDAAELAELIGALAWYRAPVGQA